MRMQTAELAQAPVSVRGLKDARANGQTTVMRNPAARPASKLGLHQRIADMPSAQLFGDFGVYQGERIVRAFVGELKLFHTFRGVALIRPSAPS